MANALVPDDLQDGFITERPDMIGGGYNVQVGPQRIGRYSSQRSAERALHEVAIRVAWLISAEGEESVLWIADSELAGEHGLAT